MDALKEVMGGGQNNFEPGQEPVSGQQCEVTTTQPYKSGNPEDNLALGITQLRPDPVSGEQGEGTAMQPFDQGYNEDDPELSGKAPQYPTSGDVTPTPTSSKHSNTSEEGTDSWWFMHINPFAKHSNVPSESATEPETSQREQRSAMSMETQTSKSDDRPPNHLGENVPPGQRAIVHDPVIDPAFTASGSVANYPGDNGPSSQTDSFDRSKGKGKGRAPLVEDNDHRDFYGVTEVSSTASMYRPDSMVTDYTYPTAGTDASTIASSSRRSSGVMNIPHSRGKPITAGGVPLGLRAMQDRERRFSSMPIYEQPEQDYHTYSKSVSVPAPSKAHQSPEPPANGQPASALRGPNPSVGFDDQRKKQPVTEMPTRKLSVIQKARSLGRKVRHSISS